MGDGAAPDRGPAKLGVWLTAPEWVEVDLALTGVALLFQQDNATLHSALSAIQRRLYGPESVRPWGPPTPEVTDG